MSTSSPPSPLRSPHVTANSDQTDFDRRDREHPCPLLWDCELNIEQESYLCVNQPGQLLQLVLDPIKSMRIAKLPKLEKNDEIK